MLAAALLPLAAKAGQLAGVPISDATVTQVAEMAAGLFLYAVTHRAISAKTNPQDAATAVPPPPPTERAP